MREGRILVSNPHGGKLIRVQQVQMYNSKLKDLRENKLKLRVSSEVKTTLRNLANGVLSPLEGFMCWDDYLHVINNMRLANGTPWTIPVLLRAPEEFTVGNHDQVTLVDEFDGEPLALFNFEEEFRIVKQEEALKVFGTDDRSHPGVARLYEGPERILGGKLSLVVRQHASFDHYFMTPKDTRAVFQQRNWKRILAFHTGYTPGIGREYVQNPEGKYPDGFFVNPLVGKKEIADLKTKETLESHQALAKNYYPSESAIFGVLYYEMQYAGPKEAIMHAIMRKNFGCTHIAIGRDHAGTGDYYESYAAHEIFKEFPDLGIEPVLLRDYNYIPNFENPFKGIHTPSTAEYIVGPSHGSLQLEEGISKSPENV
jgi:sulfate adenylyltransferase